MGIIYSCLSNSYAVDLCSIRCGHKFVIGIHSNMSNIDESGGATSGSGFGHSWITINVMSEDLQTRESWETFGMWPDNHAYVMETNNGLQNQSDNFTDVRIGVERRMQDESVSNRYGLIQEWMIPRLENRLSANLEYNFYLRNCSTFARGTWNMIFYKDRIRGRSFGAITPMKVGFSIDSKERRRSTSLQNPYVHS